MEIRHTVCGKERETDVVRSEIGNWKIERWRVAVL